MNKPVVITGIGLVAPLRPFGTVNEFWKSLCAGTDAVRRMRVPVLDLEREWPMAGIELPERYSSTAPEEKAYLIAEHALAMAIEDAGLMHEVTLPLTPSRRGRGVSYLAPGGRGLGRGGLSVGTVLGNILSKEKRMMQEARQESRVKGHGSCEESLSFLCSHLAKKFKLEGPRLTISTACASGTDAIGIASRKISSGKADIMIAGGVDVLSDFAVLGFHTLQALTGDRVRPFDKNRTGLALGEGAAFVVLEPEQRALSRGVKIYGRISGYASRADANHLTGPHREGRGLADAMRKAVSGSGIKPQDVRYINAHGTGTAYNDLMETKAIKTVFGSAAYEIPVSSTKSMLGHAFGASGAIEAICCLLAMNNGRVPPTINYQEPDPECDLDYVPNESRQCEVNASMSLSAGFGGQNSAIVFTRG